MDLSKVYYARYGKEWYHVWPIYMGEALVKLYPLDADMNIDATKDTFKVLVGDFLEEYTLFSIDMQEIQVD